MFLSSSLLWVILALSSTQVLAAPNVILGQTTIAGKESNTASGQLVEFYGGIPFAEAPIGSLRLQKPVFLPNLPSGAFDATNFGLACLQAGIPANALSEDCLHLNVWRPAGISSNAKLPILVWIYGGAFMAGSTSTFDGAALVARSIARGSPIIVASMNYRVGPLGFPPGIEAKERGILNLGLHDQLAALRWINQNIAAFGGDPRKVTTFGESAGASSIQFHLYGSTLQKYTRAAIMESVAFPPTYPTEREQGSWVTFVSGVPACASLSNTTNTLDCILAADSSALLQSIANLPPLGASVLSPYQPVIDGPGGILPARPTSLYPKSRIPIIIGANLDEGTVFSPPTVSSNADIKKFLLEATSPPIVSSAQQNLFLNSLISLYPDDPAQGSPYGTGNETFGHSPSWKKYNAIWGDILFHSMRRSTALQWTMHGLPVYAYHFVDPNAAAATIGFPLPFAGVLHGGEVAYLFNDAGLPFPSSEVLSRQMQDYWLSFVVSLNPNDSRGSGRPNWPAYNLLSPRIMELNGTSSSAVPDTYRLRQMAYLALNNLAVRR